MDPLTLNIAMGLVTNGLYDLIKHVGHLGLHWLDQDDEEIEESEFSEVDGGASSAYSTRATDHEEIIRTAVKEGIEHFITTHGSFESSPADCYLIAQFLGTPEAEAIVRQIYAADLSVRAPNNSAAGALETVRQAFSAAFRLFATSQGIALNTQLEHAGRLTFDSLASACVSALSAAADHGALTAHEALSMQRHMILLDELEAVKKVLALLTGKNKPNLADIVDFEQKYREVVAQRHAYITPQNFDTARKVPIDDLYVCPMFHDASTTKRDTESWPLTMGELLANAYRLVVLGNPGAGKSTFARKLCYDMSSRYSDRLFAGRLATPILVVLREYGAERRDKACSILQYIEARARTDYQIDPPTGAFDYLLTTGRVVVIFDGLDELLDTSYRQEISADIEVFCTHYPSVPVLVTSRQVGYDQAPLDPRRFPVFRLASFDYEQTDDYVRKWFASETDLSRREQRQKVAGFLSESADVDDLRSNPLMLSLMCTLYRGQGYIPRNRPDVYEKCATLLFERWDKSRGIRYEVPYEAHFGKVIQYLAYWILNDDKLRNGVREELIVRKAVEYLYPKRIEDMDEATNVAREYVTFCRGRAWILTDTGTTPAGDCLYQFTHQTFLEYFAALYLVGTNPTPARLKKVILPKIAKQEWDMVAQLAFQLQDKRVERAGDELLIELVNNATTTTLVRKRNLLLFGARMLHYMVPGQTVTRQVVTVCAEEILVASLELPVPGSNLDPDVVFEGPWWREVIIALMDVPPDNFRSVESALSMVMISHVGKHSSLEAQVVLELCAHDLGSMSTGHTPPLAAKNWLQICTAIYKVSESVISTQAKTNLSVAYHGVLQRMVNVGDFLKWHGPESLFASVSHRVPINEDASLSQILLSGSNYQRELEEIGQFAMSYCEPWVRRPLKEVWAVEYPSPFQGRREPKNQVGQRAPTELFGSFCVLAAWLEVANRSTPSRLNDALQELQRRTDSLGMYLFALLSARFEPTDSQLLGQQMVICGFTPEHIEFVQAWIKQDFDFVRFDSGTRFELQIFDDLPF